MLTLILDTTPKILSTVKPVDRGKVDDRFVIRHKAVAVTKVMLMRRTTPEGTKNK